MAGFTCVKAIASFATTSAPSESPVPTEWCSTGMTLFYYDPVFMEHNTKEHPENAGRLRAVMRHLSFVGLDSMCKRPAWEPVSRERLQRVHTPAYIDSLEQLAASGGGLADPDTMLSERSFDVALMATGAVCDAVVRVIDGDAENAFCLLRPPGHHALSDRAMGFCLFNHVAVA